MFRKKSLVIAFLMSLILILLPYDANASQCGSCHEPLPDAGTPKPKPQILRTQANSSLGDPFYKETNSIDKGSTILDVGPIPPTSPDDGAPLTTPDDGAPLPIRIQGSYIANGTLSGVRNVTGNVIENVTENVTEWVTNVGTLTSDGEYIQSKGIISNPDGEIATYIGFSFGQSNEEGERIYRGFNIYSADSGGKLAFLDGKVGLSLYLHGANGTFTGEVYEWE